MIVVMMMMMMMIMMMMMMMMMGMMMMMMIAYDCYYLLLLLFLNCFFGVSINGGSLWQSNITTENHHFFEVNQVYMAISIAMLVYQRVLFGGWYPIKHHPTIGDTISNRYVKVMWNKSPKRDIYKPHLGVSIHVKSQEMDDNWSYPHLWYLWNSPFVITIIATMIVVMMMMMMMMMTTTTYDC